MLTPVPKEYFKILKFLLLLYIPHDAIQSHIGGQLDNLDVGVPMTIY